MLAKALSCLSSWTGSNIIPDLPNVAWKVYISGMGLSMYTSFCYPFKSVCPTATLINADSLDLLLALSLSVAAFLCQH